jgi:hypothetical protein
MSSSFIAREMAFRLRLAAILLLERAMGIEPTALCSGMGRAVSSVVMR